MKYIRTVLKEEKGEKAHREAEAMGLKYKGFGYWVDPSTGEVTHKTEGDQLVAVEPDVSTEKAGKEMGGPEAGTPSGSFQNQTGMGSSFGTHMNKQNPTGMGTNVLSAPEPGQETPNPDAGRWQPGPDGDNMVKGQKKGEKDEMPKDTFVGKTNYYQWTAGSDGDNYKTMSFDDMMKKVLAIPIEEAEDMGHRTMFRKMLGFEGSAPDDPSHVQKARQVYKQQGDTGKGEMMRDVMARGNDTQGMAIQMDRLPAKMARRDEKKGRVKQLNQSIRELVQDPDYDMSQKGEEIGSGMFGSVYDSKDGKNVIKEGKLSAKEMAILSKLKDVKAFPNLVNAEVSTPFESAKDIYDHGSDSENEALNDDSMGEGMRYFDDLPFAEGKMVMSKINGYPYSEMQDMMTEEEKQKFVQKLWNARGAMHKLGISHNDMHGGNFFVDDAGNPGILDLGLADDDPLTALMEGIGGATGTDFQLQSDAKMGQMSQPFNFVPEALKERIKGNMGKLRETLQEKMMDYMGDPEDWEDGEDPDEAIENKIGQVMRGGLRLTRGRLDDLREQMPFLEDNDTVLELIKNLYDNVQDTETGQRMSNAFDNLKNDRLKVARANILRKQKGIPEIQDKLKDVLDPDD